jgi:phage baseplate assembly protein W
MNFDDGLNVDQRIIGRGFGFPMGVDSRGAMRMSQGAEDIAEAIRLILGTAPGERRMRPEFGCNLHDMVFAPMNETTMTAIRYHVTQALERWEPRIELNEVRVEPSTDLEGCLLINIAYTIRSTLDKRTLVYPFYNIPEEP